jgi:hypothetical protein
VTVEKVQVDVALLHYPVRNRKAETIGSAVTNLDLHDIARACRTYGVGTYWVVTPYVEQQELVAQITGHWTQGYGAKVNPDRHEALELITVCDEIEQALAGSEHKWGRRPLVVATGANGTASGTDYVRLRARIEQGEPVLLLFGTAWGLAEEQIDCIDCTLPPIYGQGAYNHLSVRSAASIILDRLLAR